MAIPHAKPGELIDFAPLGSQLTSKLSTTLVKTNSLEVLRLVLPAGKTIPPHSVPGEITVQSLEGRVIFTVGGIEHELMPGKFLYLAGNEKHALQAIDDSSLLVTILLPVKSPPTTE